MLLQWILCIIATSSVCAQDRVQDEILKKTHSSGAMRSCGNISDMCCDQALRELGFIESQIEKLIECSCCQYIITQADIDAGNYTITAPGFYCLKEDIVFTGSGNAITINNSSSEVTLDLRGHVITGDGTNGVGIYIVNASNGTTVQNGSVSECEVGIIINNSTQVSVDTVNISLCREYGILVDNSETVVIQDAFVRNIIGGSLGHGIALLNVNMAEIIKSTIVQTQGSGVFIDGSSQCAMSDLKVIAMDEYGFYVADTLNYVDSLCFKNCSVESAGLGGYVIFSVGSNGVQGVQYIHCKGIAVGGNGFDIDSLGTVTSIEYIECEAKANDGNGFSTNSHGIGSQISVVNYDNCISQLNNANGGLGVNGDGFYIDGESFVVKASSASRNQGSGIVLTLNSYGVEIINNSLFQNNFFGIEDQGSSNLVYSNVASNNGTNYSASVPLQLMPTDITGYWINVDPTSSTVGEYESKINIILDFEQSCCDAIASSFEGVASQLDVLAAFEQSCCASIENDIATIAGQLYSLTTIDTTCCQAATSALDIATSIISTLHPCPVNIITADPYPITAPGVYTLCSDIYSSGFFGYVVNVNSNIPGEIVIDLNGHYMVGTGLGAAISVSASAGPVIIKNGVIQSYEYGIQSVVGDLYIQDIAIAAAQTGIDLQGGDNFVLENIVVNNVSQRGVHLSGVTNVSVKNATISQVGNSCFAIRGLVGGVFDSIRTIAYGYGNGIYITNETSDSLGMSFVNCSFEEQRNGIVVEQIDNIYAIGDISFSDTVVAGSNSIGVYIFGSNSGFLAFYPVLFKNCVIEGSGSIGCQLSLGYNHTFDSCSISNNAIYGVLVNGATQCKVINSTINNNGAGGPGFGISIEKNDFFIKNSNISNNVQYGIYLANDPSVLNVQIIDCVLSKNEKIGIFAEAENTVIRACTVVGSDIGMYVSSLATNTQILSSYVSNNLTAGIINDSITSYIWGNNASKNGTNYSGAFSPINSIISLAAQYWANVGN